MLEMEWDRKRPGLDPWSGIGMTSPPPPLSLSPPKTKKKLLFNYFIN